MHIIHVETTDRSGGPIGNILVLSSVQVWFNLVWYKSYWSLAAMLVLKPTHSLETYKT